MIDRLPIHDACCNKYISQRNAESKELFAVIDQIVANDAADIH